MTNERDLTNTTMYELLKNIQAMLEIVVNKQLAPERNDWIDIEQAAVICNLSVRTIYNYINSGRLRVPIVKKGNKLFFERLDVIKWSADREVRIIYRNDTRKEAGVRAKTFV